MMAMTITVTMTMTMLMTLIFSSSVNFDGLIEVINNQACHISVIHGKKKNLLEILRG